MAKLNPREIAQASALRGDIETALAGLSALQQEGDTAVNASLAEIAAFQGDWDAVLRYAPAVTVDPKSVQTLNVYADMLKLIGIAGVRTENWDEVQAAAVAALSVLGEVQMLPGYEAAAAGLGSFAATQGRASSGWRPGGHDERPEEERIAKFESAIARLSKNKKRFKTPQARLNHCIAIARNCAYHEAAISLYDETGSPELFDSVVFVASALARFGRQDEAWTVIQSKLSQWWPVEDTQIVPVALLADDALRPLMTPERCKEVLQTPRGAEAP